eukprot:gene22636-27329_t
MHENLATTREVNDAKGAASCTLSIAPMMECTDKHYRCLARLLTRHTQLYTEMVVDQSIIYNQAQVIGPAQSYEHPITVQLGGSDPEMLAKAAVVCERLGYDEINLNIGVDDLDQYEHLKNFVETVVEALGPTAHFIVHARKAFLEGLSPAENRSVPPLQYHV